MAFVILDFNFCSFEHCYRLVQHSGCTKAEALEAASSRWNYRKYAPRCVLSKHLITDKIEVPSIFSNSEMVSCIIRSFQRKNHSFRPAQILGLEAKKGSLEVRKLYFHLLISGFWRSRSIVPKEITKESFEFICQLKLKPKQIPLQIIASLKSVNTINSCESHSNQRLKLVDLSKLGNCDTNKRSVKVGCDADFIMLEPDTLQLVSTWVAGVKVFPQF